MQKCVGRFLLAKYYEAVIPTGAVVWDCKLQLSNPRKFMPTTKQELEIYHEDYVNSVKRNLHLIGEHLKHPTKRAMFTPEAIEILASHGLAIKTIASMFGHLSTTITNDPEYLAAFEKGRSQIASKIRASLVEDALNKDLISAKLYLDKIYNKDEQTQEINLNVSQRPLENVTDEQLLQIDLDDSTQSN